MEIKTKYDIGQKLFWITTNGTCNIQYTSVKGINIGGKAWEKYKMTHGDTRGEHEVFETFEEAKKEAIKKQKGLNKVALETVEELTEPRFTS